MMMMMIMISCKMNRVEPKRGVWSFCHKVAKRKQKKMNTCSLAINHHRLLCWWWWMIIVVAGAIGIVIFLLGNRECIKIIAKISLQACVNIQLQLPKAILVKYPSGRRPSVFTGGGAPLTKLHLPDSCWQIFNTEALRWPRKVKEKKIISLGRFFFYFLFVCVFFSFRSEATFFFLLQWRTMKNKVV